METDGRVGSVLAGIGGVVAHGHGLLLSAITVEDIGHERLWHSCIEGYVARVDDVDGGHLSEEDLVARGCELMALVALVVKAIVMAKGIDIAVIEIDIADARACVEPYDAVGIADDAIDDLAVERLEDLSGLLLIGFLVEDLDTVGGSHDDLAVILDDAQHALVVAPIPAAPDTSEIVALGRSHHGTGARASPYTSVAVLH